MRLGHSKSLVTNFGAGGSGNTVSILRNVSTSGNVSFAAKSDLVAVTGALGIVGSDLDGDGKPDLAVTNYDTNWPQPVNLGSSVSVFANTSVSGAISFASKVDYGTNAGPHAVTAGDVNQDNKPDLVVVNYGNADGTTVSVLQNSTGVVFNAPTPTPTGATATPTNASTATNTSVPPTATNTPAPGGDLLFDDFPGTTLSSSWFVPFFASAPTLSGGVAAFNAGNTIESNRSFVDLTAFEIQAQYSASSGTGLCWTNAGFRIMYVGSRCPRTRRVLPGSLAMEERQIPVCQCRRAIIGTRSHAVGRYLRCIWMAPRSIQLVTLSSVWTMLIYQVMVVSR